MLRHFAAELGLYDHVESIVGKFIRSTEPLGPSYITLRGIMWYICYPRGRPVLIRHAFRKKAVVYPSY